MAAGGWCLMVRDDAREDARREPSRRTRASRTSRLDVPKDTRRALIRRPDYDPEMFGRFAETFARFMGTARFLFFMTVFVIIWLTINIVGVWGLEWDPYPFILLNLFFSTQASYAAPLILLAQNRQAERDRAQIERDREVTARTLADTEFLAREITSVRLAVAQLITERDLTRELGRLTAELEALRTEVARALAEQRTDTEPHQE